MSNVSIFKDKNAVSLAGKRELSTLAKSLAGATAYTSRRISIANSTFRKVVNGEVIAKIKDRELNVIIVNALPKVSRMFYAEQYDPNKEATLPDCWSNLGDKPEPQAANPQHSNCADCPQNIKGSGANGGRACRFQRRIAMLLEGDNSGDVYQFNIPGASLFGKGTGNTHPFESYIKYLVANGESPDTVVTQISFDLEADTMALVFSPARGITDEEYEMVQAAQGSAEAKNAVTITVAQTDGVKKLPPAVEKKVARSEEPEDEEIDEPVKRPAKKVEAPNKQSLADVVDAWKDE